MRNGLWSLAKELCKTGCLIGHRRELWCRSLAVDTTLSDVRAIRPYKDKADHIFSLFSLQHAFHYEELKCEVLKYVLVFEKLIVNVSINDLIM